MKEKTSLYMGVGCEMTHYEVDVHNATLTKRSSLTLPCGVQYAWRHPTAPFLYVACSSGGPNTQGDAHHLVALKIHETSGTLISQHSSSPLPSRPIHVTVDRAGKHVITAYNKPGYVTVHRIEADGGIYEQVRQYAEPDAGIFPHQIMITPMGKSVIVVARGNAANEGRPEDPGALKVFSYDDENGQLKSVATIAPNGGHNFGPRHLDFHPSKPWIYVSLELQNTVQMYRILNDSVEDEPAYTKYSLQNYDERFPKQRPGTIHIHPNGRFVYVANRASATKLINGESIFVGGENNIAVFEIDENSGEHRAIQHEDTRGIIARTFALDKSGRLLVVANSTSILAEADGIAKKIPPSLSLFRVGNDGKLNYVQKYDIDTGNETIFWMGIVG